MVHLSPRELLCCQLYSDGMLTKEVSLVCGITRWSVLDRIRTAREKYRGAGIDAGTRVLLRIALVADGHLPPEFGASPVP